jgi:choline dehydrogenase
MLGGCTNAICLEKSCYDLTSFYKKKGSSVNAMIAHYGDPADFDEWAQVIGDESWSYQHFSKYFRKFEHYTPRSEDLSKSSTNRGYSGPVQVGYNAHFSPINQAFLDTCSNTGISIKSDLNTSAGTKGASRVSQAYSFIHSASLQKLITECARSANTA